MTPHNFNSTNLPLPRLKKYYNKDKTTLLHNATNNLYHMNWIHNSDFQESTQMKVFREN